MADRTKPQSMPHRRVLPWRAYDAINRRDCLHIDAWLYQGPNDDLYFVLESRAGGQQVLKHSVLRLDSSQLVPVADLPPDCTQRHINSPWARRYAPDAAAYHTALIQPWLRGPREGFKAPHSIALHYVWSDPAISDPCDGLTNYYVATGRAERDAAQAKPTLVLRDTNLRQAWGAAERSRLRTLDKLLKP